MQNKDVYKLIWEFYKNISTVIITVLIISALFGAIDVSQKSDKQEFCYKQCKIQSKPLFEWIKDNN